MPDTGAILHSIITCPKCGARASEVMPINACQYFYDCTVCGAVLKPKPGDCCVYCSYGSVPCPSKQSGAVGSCAGPGTAEEPVSNGGGPFSCRQ